MGLASSSVVWTQGTIGPHKVDLDFFDTFYPVTRITSIRLLIVIAAIFYLKIHQMNVKTAFLNGDLEKEIYIDQSEGFVEPG